MFLWNASFIFVLMFIPIYHLHHLICNLYSGSKGCSCLWLASGCLWPVQAPGYTTLTVRRTTVSLNTAINCPNVCPGAPADFSQTVLRCCPPRPRRLHSLAWPIVLICGTTGLMCSVVCGISDVHDITTFAYLPSFLANISISCIHFVRHCLPSQPITIH